MKAKKTLLILLTALTLFSLAACSNSSSGGSSSTTTQTESAASWFTSDQLTAVGAQGLTLPQSATVTSNNGLKAELTGLTADTYKTFVADVLKGLETNNTAVASINGQTFSKIDLATYTVDETAESIAFYKAGDKFFSISLKFSDSNTVIEFKDVTADYPDAKIE